MILGSLCLLILAVLCGSSPVDGETLTAPCVEPGFRCCRGSTGSLPSQYCNSPTTVCRGSPGVCVACGTPGLFPCYDNDGCSGTRPYIQTYYLDWGVMPGRCAECPDPRYWAYTPPPPGRPLAEATCVRRCGSIRGLPLCRQCKDDIPNAHVNEHGVCASCDTETNNYFPDSDAGPAFCEPCGTESSVPCLIGGCLGMKNPYVDKATGFCASCDTSATFPYFVYTSGKTLFDATCVPRCIKGGSAYPANGSQSGFGNATKDEPPESEKMFIGQEVFFGAPGWNVTSFSVTVAFPPTLQFTGNFATWVEYEGVGEVLYTSEPRSTAGGTTVETFEFNVPHTVDQPYVFYLAATNGSGNGSFPVYSPVDVNAGALETGYVYRVNPTSPWFGGITFPQALIYEHTRCLA